MPLDSFSPLQPRGNIPALTHLTRLINLWIIRAKGQTKSDITNHLAFEENSKAEGRR
jgi:hypothetical protein